MQSVRFNNRLVHSVSYKGVNFDVCQEEMEVHSTRTVGKVSRHRDKRTVPELIGLRICKSIPTSSCNFREKPQ